VDNHHTFFENNDINVPVINCVSWTQVSS